jgi:hypothetical protein
MNRAHYRRSSAVLIFPAALEAKEQLQPPMNAD